MRIPFVGDTIVVWFSSGAASAVAAFLTVQEYGLWCRVRVVNNPVVEEDPDNLRFLRDVEEWLGISIEKAVNPDYPEASAQIVWERRKFMCATHGAPCTLLLKKRARENWEKENSVDWHVLGFTAEEEKRLQRFRGAERDNTLGVLVDSGLTKEDCYKILKNHGIEPPAIYRRGYPNANCIGCVKATSPTYWNLVRRQDPEVFECRAEQSRRLGAKLVRYKGKRIFLDELPADAVGRPLKSMDVECGVFCEKDREE